MKLLYLGTHDTIINFKWKMCYVSLIRTIKTNSHKQIEGILPKWPYQPCLRVVDRALLAGYPRNIASAHPSIGASIYFADKQKFLDAMLCYMPACHRQFIRDVRHGPPVREFGEM